jgi:predicted CoA-substrate-specific enzyme activase
LWVSTPNRQRTPWERNSLNLGEQETSATMKNKHIGKDYYVGIDAGSVSLNCVVLDHDRKIVREFPYRRHFGKVEEETFLILKEIDRSFREENIRSIAFTGNHGKNLSERLGAFYEFETISQVLGVLSVQPDARTIISMGGQDTALFQIRHFDRSWELEYFSTNGPCASGTGSFIDQQAERLATSLYERTQSSPKRIDATLADFIHLGLQSRKPANVACRCTVFTKSDMIHLQNKGERLEDIIYGLHLGNAMNYISTIVSTRTLEEPIVFVGGVSLNALQVRAFRTYFPGLLVPSCSTSTGAIGVALKAQESNRQDLIKFDFSGPLPSHPQLTLPAAARLSLHKTRWADTGKIHKRITSDKTRVYLGIDIGSTTTKYALVTENREIVHKSYVPTQGKPVEVTQRLLRQIMEELGRRIDLVGTATTGSGRNVVGDFLNADLIIDEITAHARGAVEIDPAVDTIFEIGGQDSKFISISNTYPLDFDMNKVCAAGTGSFLHELAGKYGINIVGEFQEIALTSEKPVKLAERCTVFMESDLVAYHQKGADRKDLIAGLCYAIVHNYLNRVVGKRKIGQRIMFLGGPSLNMGVVAAFENVLGREILVPPHREVLGAYGAALSVREKMAQGKREGSTFRGLESAVKDCMGYSTKVCHADPSCHNECKLKIYDFDGRRSIWGGECGRYDVIRIKGPKKENSFDARQEIWQTYVEGVHEELKNRPLMEVEGRPTVGMMRAFYGIHTSVLWAHFFDQLGYRLVLTPPTNQQISKAGIESMVAETCYPVKVAHGHAKAIAGKTRYLFMPTLVDMATPEPTEMGYYCPLVQSISFIIQAAINLEKTSILDPTVHLKHKPDILAQELFEQLRTKLRVRKKDVKRALLYALERHQRFLNDLHQRGRTFLENRSPKEPFVVVTGRPYNLYDERLNLRLGQNLAKIGLESLPMDFLDVASMELSEFPSMYWGSGAQILRTAKFIKQRWNCFGLHLTNFSCGADSFIEHFYRHLMGGKPALILELDEHSGVAGVMTRIEAFKNVIDNVMQEPERSAGMSLKLAN